MIDDRAESREAPVMIKAALLMAEQAAERRGAIHAGGRSFRLEIVDPDLVGGVHVVTGFGKQRRNVTPRALGLSVEEVLSELGRGVEGELSFGRIRRGKAELIIMKRREFAGDEIGSVAHIGEPI